MKKTISLLAAVLITSTLAFAGTPPESTKDVFDSLVSATINNDYSAFQEQGDSAFKEGITKQSFQAVSSQLAPLLKDGYDADFLTAMKQQGYDVFVWKITPKVGDDQFLARLVMDDGKASGFWIQ